MQDKGVLKIDKIVIERLEELVEQISACFTVVPPEIIEEMNNLSKNEWSEKEYILYCAEYWSRSTLEETVYALLHDGEYPENVDEELYFWKSNKNIDLSDEKIMFKLRKLPETVDENIICNFGDLPIHEFYDWLKSFLKDWTMDEEVNEDEIQSGSFEVSFECDIYEYAKYRSIDLSVYGNKLINLDCCNLSEKEKDEIISFANKYGLYLYVR